MSSESDLTCAITMMYPVSLPHELLGVKVQGCVDLIKNVQQKYGQNIVVVEFLDAFIQTLHQSTVSISRLARMTCVMQTLLDLDEEGEFTTHVLSMMSTQAPTFEQLLLTYEYLDMAHQHSVLHLLLQWHQELYPEYVKVMKDTLQVYVATKNKLIKLRLRTRLQPHLKTHGLQWTWLADFDDVKRKLAKERQTLRAWNTKHLLLTQIQLEYAPKQQPKKGFLEALFGGGTAKDEDKPRYHASWSTVKPLLQTYLDTGCQNHTIPMQIVHLCSHTVEGQQT